MFYDDHPPPHFHASYGEYVAKVLISDGSVMEGQLPIRALRLVQEWTAAHTEELMANWDKAGKHEALDKIEPLP